MAAMEAADANGGDHRCNCGNNPPEFVPCDNKTAHVAYIAIANKDDQVGVTHNDGKYFAYIAVGDNDIKKGESANPVKTLRMRYNAWVKGGAKRTDPPGPTPYKCVAAINSRCGSAASGCSIAAGGAWLHYYCPPRPPRCGGGSSTAGTDSAPR